MAVVATALGRRWVGIEEEERYIKVAEKRLNDYLKSKE